MTDDPFDPAELDHDLDLLQGSVETFNVRVKEDPVYSHWSSVFIEPGGEWSVTELYGPAGLTAELVYWRDHAMTQLDRSFPHQPTAGPDYVGPVPDTFLPNLLQDVADMLKPHRAVFR